jgi:hypothetical protein
LNTVDKYLASYCLIAVISGAESYDIFNDRVKVKASSPLSTPACNDVMQAWLDFIVTPVGFLHWLANCRSWAG